MSRNFNGSTDYLTVAQNFGITSVPLSVSAWFRPGNLTRTEVIFALTNASPGDGQYMTLRGASAGDPICADSNQSGVAFSEAISGSTGMSTGNWYHAVCVFTSTTSRSVYFNGASPVTDTVSVNPNTLTQVTIGAYGTASSYFTGEIANVGMWNAALNADDVAALFAGFTPRKVKPQNLVMFTPLAGGDNGEPDVIFGGIFTRTGTTFATERPRQFFI